MKAKVLLFMAALELMKSQLCLRKKAGVQFFAVIAK